MDFEWDENKRHANLLKHALDLLRGSELFDGRSVYVYASPRSGEQRFVTIALLNDVIVALAWTLRDGNTRLISLRRARHGEERTYRALFG